MGRVQRVERTDARRGQQQSDQGIVRAGHQQDRQPDHAVHAAVPLLGCEDIMRVAAVLLIAVASLSAQQPPPQGRGGGGGGRGPQGAEPLVIDDKTGFQPIFDGTSLKGWDGDPAFWKAVDGAIVGESSPDNAVKENTFLIWRGGEPRDFELKLQFRMNST